MLACDVRFPFVLTTITSVDYELAITVISNFVNQSESRHGNQACRPRRSKVERVASVAWMVGLGRGVRPKWPALTSRGPERLTAAALASTVGPGDWIGTYAVLGSPGRSWRDSGNKSKLDHASSVGDTAECILCVVSEW